MLVRHCNVITDREITRIIRDLLAADPAQIIVPAKVYRELRKALQMLRMRPQRCGLDHAGDQGLSPRDCGDSGEAVAPPIAPPRLQVQGSKPVKGEAQVIERLNEALFLELGR